MSTNQFYFGSGTVALEDASGNNVPVAEVVDVSIEVVNETKELKGQHLMPIDVAIVARKVTGKAKFAKVSGALLASALGGSAAAGGKKVADREIHAAAASVDATNKAGFVDDLGVLDNDGNSMTKVTADPEVGQYAVAAGVYTFNALQTGNVALSYTHTVATGETISATNGVPSAATTYKMDFTVEYGGKQIHFHFPKVVMPKLALGFKAEDYVESDIDFQVIAPGIGNFVEVYTS